MRLLATPFLQGLRREEIKVLFVQDSPQFFATVNGSIASLNQNYMGMLVVCSCAYGKRRGSVNQTAWQDAVRLIITKEVGRNSSISRSLRLLYEQLLNISIENQLFKSADHPRVDG